MDGKNMTEKEKCQEGLLYDANYDKNLEMERSRCKDLCHTFNSILPSQQEKRREIMGTILGKTGAVFLIEQSFWCDYGYNIEIGERFYANHGCVILDAASVIFGDDVFVAPNCGFYTAGHPLSPDLRNRGLEYAKPITVGNNVWIGGNVTVMPGVTIGDNTIIGSGSVVTKDIPSGVIAVGNPCRILREITEEEIQKERRSIL